MMRDETMKKIETMREKAVNGFFTERMAKGIVSISTLKKYNLIETTYMEVERREITIDELIENINGMIGEDCYYCDGRYERVNNKIFYIREEYGYKFK